MSAASVCPSCGLAAIPREPDAPRCSCPWERIGAAYAALGQTENAEFCFVMADKDLGKRGGHTG